MVESSAESNIMLEWFYFYVEKVALVVAKWGTFSSYSVDQTDFVIS